LERVSMGEHVFESCHGDQHTRLCDRGRCEFLAILQLQDGVRVLIQQ
jgi:hypothetical protein